MDIKICNKQIIKLIVILVRFELLSSLLNKYSEVKIFFKVNIGLFLAKEVDFSKIYIKLCGKIMFPYHKKTMI
jgi:hypothetical protein